MCCSAASYYQTTKQLLQASARCLVDGAITYVGDCKLDGCLLQVMKINAKLSGVNVSLISRPVPWMNEPFMILGECLSELHAIEILIPDNCRSLLYYLA